MEQNQKQIAATILEQMGGKGFILMTGAKNLFFLPEDKKQKL